MLFCNTMNLAHVDYAISGVKGQSLDDDNNDDDENGNEEGTAKTQLCCCCCPCFCLPAKWIKLFNQWFEVVCTVLSELLIYPLVILDL